jgi:tripartite ATP-independent transporter DctM subunit
MELHIAARPLVSDAAPSHRWLPAISRLLALLVEIPTVIAVVAEVIVLLCGVAARYVFDAPLIWSDELASIIFLWLAMFGAAVALQRGGHMRLSYLVDRLPPAGRAVAEVLNVGVPLLFVALVFSASLDYADDQSFVVTPALEWSGLVRAAAMPVGLLLIGLSAIAQLLRHRLRDVAIGAGLLAALAVVLWLAAPALHAMGNWNLAVFFVVLLGAAVLSGLPIAFGFALSTIAYLLTTTSTPLSIVVGRIDEGMSSLILLAVPLFVLLGQLMDMMGLARVLVGFLAALMGHVRAGLSYVLIGAILLVSGISGSKTADLAAVAPVLFPEMKRRGANEGELIALLAASGAMSETIPPSIVLIVIGSVTSVSISGLFTAGLLPGLFLALILCLMARRSAGRENLAGVTRAPARVVLRSFVVAIPALLLPFVIRGAVVEGIATATEVSTIGVAYTIVVGLLVYRQFDWRRIYPMLVDTANLSGAILLIIGGATAMAWALTQSGFSTALASFMAGLPGGRWSFLAISILVFAVLGSVLEGIPAMVLFGPLLFPVARALGINELHYAVVVILAMGIGLFAPPFGLGYYAACIIGRVPPEVALRRIWPYLGALTIGIVIIALVPWLSTGIVPAP